MKKNDPGFGADVDRAAQRSARRKDRRRKELAARGLQPIARRLTDLGLSHPSATTLALEFPAERIFRAIEYAESKRARIRDFPSYLHTAIVKNWQLAPHVRRQLHDADRELQRAALQHAAAPSQVAAAERAIAAEPDSRTDEEWLRSRPDVFRRAFIEPRAQREIGIPPDHPEYAERLRDAELRVVRSMRTKTLQTAAAV